MKQYLVHGGIIVVFLLILLAFWASIKKKDWFNKRLQVLRGILYLVSIFATGIYIFTLGTMAKWTYVGMIVSVFVYIDLVLFSRPKIKKLWGAEFEDVQDLALSAYALKEQTVSDITKAGIMSDLVGRVDKNQFGRIQWNSVEEYADSLQYFLMEYTNVCFQDVYVLDYSSPTLFSQQVGVLGFEVNREHLEKLDNVEVAFIGEDTGLIPSTVVKPIAAIVKQRQGKLLELDFRNIQNLITIHSYFGV